MGLVTINPRINGWNEASRMALTQSLVERGSLSIDESTFISTGDKVYIRGHYYSDKPVMPALLATIVYAPLYALGLELDYGYNLSYYLIILMTMKVFWILSILAFRQALQLTAAKPSQIPLLTFIYALASLTFTWSSTFNNHSLAGSSLMIALYFYLKAKDSASNATFLWSGFMFGLAAAMDIPTVVFLVGFGSLMVLNSSSRMAVMSFTAGAIVPVSIHLAVNYAIGGTLLPLQINPEFFQFEGSVWTTPQALSGTTLNPISFALPYAFLSLFGVKGFIWYNPILFLLLPIMYQHLRKKGRFQQETATILAGTLILMTYYFLYSSNYGGWSYSIRWFIPPLSLMMFYLFDLGDWSFEPGKRYALWGLLIISVIVASIGIINPWSNQDLHPIPIIANLMQLLKFLT